MIKIETLKEKYESGKYDGISKTNPNNENKKGDIIKLLKEYMFKFNDGYGIIGDCFECPECGHENNFVNEYSELQCENCKCKFEGPENYNWE